jgi:drug/metabolite transporter (DMT)-like permease
VGGTDAGCWWGGEVNCTYIKDEQREIDQLLTGPQKKVQDFEDSLYNSFSLSHTILLFLSPSKTFAHAHTHTHTHTHNSAFFYGIQRLPLPDAVTLQFTTPVFAALFAVALVGEEWKRLDMIGAVVCLMGVCLIAHPTWLFGEMIDNNDVENDDGNDILMTTSVPSLLTEANTTMEETTITLESSGNGGSSGGSSSRHQGIAVAVTTAGAAMAGLAYVSVRLISGTSANVMVLYYAVMSIPIVFCGSYGLLDKWRVWAPDTIDSSFSLGDYFLLLLTGFAGYGGQFFTNLGLQREQAATGTLATSTQIVWTYIFEMMFLHEGINGWSLAGTGLILGFMLIVGISKVAERNNKDNDDASSKTNNTREESEMLLAQSEC